MIPSAGCASLDLCYVACGRFTAFWEVGLEPWDTGAGAFKVEMPHLLASNGKIHRILIDKLRRFE